MFCKNCGTQLKEGALFCTNCGMKIMPAGAETVQRSEPVQSVGQQPYNDAFHQQPVRHRKTLQIPMIIVAIAIVIVVGCLAAVLFIRSRESDEEAADREVISREKADPEKEDADRSDKRSNFFERSKNKQDDEARDDKEQNDEEYNDEGQDIREVEEPMEEMSRQYILPNSDSVYLSYRDLVGMTAEECRLARNELYARHGRKFDDEGLQSYFNEKDWYTGYIDPEDFSDSVLNDFEIANRDLIVQYEEEMGYR